mgnify:CR=1 FL=1
MKLSANIITNNEQECIKEGLKFSRKISNGDTIVLEGDLGTGKTTFVKGILKGLNYPYEVTSPTFTLINEYAADKKIIHIDFYREKRPERWRLIGLDEYVDSKDCITIIEWGNLHPELLPEHVLKIKFAHMGENKRKIKIGI